MSYRFEVDGAEYVSDSDMEAFWRYGISLTEPKPRPAVDIRLPLGCEILNSIFDPGEDGQGRKVEVGFLRVAKYMRGNKIGERLVRGLGALTQEYVFPEMFVGLASQYSLDIFERVFGWDRMTLFGHNGGHVKLQLALAALGTTEKLDISFEKARDILVGLERLEDDPEERQLGFPVSIDLDGLEMSTWGLPVECNPEGIDLATILAVAEKSD